MSRSRVSAWLATLASVGVCLGFITPTQAQQNAFRPPRQVVDQPGVGVGVGVNVGGVGVNVGVDVGGFQGVGLGPQTIAAPPLPPTRPLEKWYYYPYYYFPHNYWPKMGPKWPENPGEPTLPPPAYMAYPPFHEPHWRYEAWEVQRYYKGFHFWLDQF